MRGRQAARRRSEDEEERDNQIHFHLFFSHYSKISHSRYTFSLQEDWLFVYMLQIRITMTA